jgi:hypothetical protein
MSYQLWTLGLLYLETLGRDGPGTPTAPPSNPPSDIGSEVGIRMQEQHQLEYDRAHSSTPSVKGTRRLVRT